MKKTILFIGIFLLSLNCISQNQEAILYLRNGDTIHGLAKITDFGKIKFRYNKKSTKKKYDGKTLKKFEIYEKDTYQLVTYCYKLVQNKRFFSNSVLMKLVTEGKINLYTMTSTVTAPIGFGSAGGMGFGMNIISNSFDHYYVCRGNSDFVIELATVGSFFGKNFIKAASEYFSDCPDLVKKIENKVYKKRDIEEIIRFYNAKCK